MFFHHSSQTFTDIYDKVYLRKMKPPIIDFRSDTVTKPSQPMLEFMMKAPLGDDVFGEDPTVNKLQTIAAEMFGKEEGLFCASGTMSNQIAIKVHTQPGEEVICDKLSHIYQYEAGGIAFNSGCSVNLIDGNRGRITAWQLQNAIHPTDIHKPNATLVSLENTSNRGGGSCYNFTEIEHIKEVCLQNNLMLHLDGARLFNALIEKNETPKQYGKIFNSISICLSKGLGAPIGSILLGNQKFIQKAKKIRKVFGGGMRQAGIVAAAGIYALENNINRLAEDHHHTKLIAQALSEKDFVGEILTVETNILIFEIMGRFTAKQFVDVLKEKNIFTIAISPSQVRIVVHLDNTPAMIQQTIQFIKTI